MNRPTIGLAILTLCLITPPYGAEAAAQITVPDSVCTGCSVELEQVLRLPSAYPSGTNDSIFLPPRLQLTKSNRRFVVGPTYGGTLVVVDSAGEFVSSIGRQGPGPGEFPGGTHMLRSAAGGLVYALHVGRLSVLDPDEPGIVDQVGLSAPLSDLIPLAPEGWIGLPGVSASLSEGPHGYKVTPEGELEDKVVFPGEAPEDAGPSDIFSMLRVIAPSGDSAVWVARTDAYLLELLDAEEGEVLLRVERDAPWYTGGPLQPEQPFQKKPEPRVRAVREDAAGRLWVLLTAAAEDWRPRAPEMGEGSEIGLSEVFDTVVEVIDLGSAQVLARTRVPPVLEFVDGSDDLVWYAEDSSDRTPVFNIKRLSIHNSNTRR